MLKYLLEKEFRQFIRNPFLMRMVIVSPVMIMLFLPLAANFEVKRVKLFVVDSDHSSYSSRLVRKAVSSGTFRLTGFSTDYSDAIRSIDRNGADVVLEIPAGFERNLMSEKKADVMIAANGVDQVKGSLGSAYLSVIVADFSADLRSGLLSPLSVPAAGNFTVIPQYRYNPHLLYPVTMVPALLVMLLAMLCGYLPALNIVLEKEKGTIEQMNVTPVHRFTLIIAKLIPYWIVGFLVLTVGFLIARFVYALVPAGSLLTLYIFSGIFILGISGFGLVISNYAETVQQAMFMIFFFVITMIFISGIYTPVSSMPAWARALSVASPLKYLIETMRMVYLKGSSVADLRGQLLALCSSAVFFNAWAVLSYKKTN
ncbi:MAG: ABC transporter permease [Treponema sp.]|jgi:ABC-2 type transport system permease protein|nr:ABC transporter permease [Treponema sp.]